MSRRVSLVKDYVPVALDDLNSLMEFDHVIHVVAPGLVNPSSRTAERYHSPYDLEYWLDEEGQCVEGSDDQLATSAAIQGWTFMTGYTRQYGAPASNFCMHQSEFVGGGMARDILERPGHYVAITLNGYMDAPDAEPEVVGWAVLYRES